MKVYSVTEINGARERREELRNLKKSNYPNMSHKKTLGSIVELNFLEILLEAQDRKYNI